MLTIKLRYTAPDQPKPWIETYWWIVLIALLAVALTVFVILYLRNRKPTMIEVTVYADKDGKRMQIVKGSTYNPDIPSIDGMRFAGWYLDSAHTVPWLSTYKVKKTMCLYAAWEKA